jgi:hypothetical protein
MNSARPRIDSHVQRCEIAGPSLDQVVDDVGCRVSLAVWKQQVLDNVDGLMTLEVQCRAM